MPNAMVIIKCMSSLPLISSKIENREDKHIVGNEEVVQKKDPVANKNDHTESKEACDSKEEAKNDLKMHTKTESSMSKERAIEYLRKMYQPNENIEYFIQRYLKEEYNLSGVEIEDNGSYGVAYYIFKEGTINKDLRLYRDHIGDEGAKAIALALTYSHTLTELYIYENNIGDEGAKAIALALTSNNVLTKLYLNENKIGDEGAMVIAQALTYDNTLTELCLHKNKIGNIGAKAIAKMLTINKTIHVLSIDYNKIGYDDAQAIAAAIVVNSALTILHVHHNIIGDEGYALLRKNCPRQLTIYYEDDIN